jgi:hypothetical protein
VQLVLKDHKVHKVHKAQLVLKVHKVLLALQMPLEQQTIFPSLQVAQHLVTVSYMKAALALLELLVIFFLMDISPRL